MSDRVLITARVFAEGGDEPERVLTDAGLEVVYPERSGPLPEKELAPALRDIAGVIAAPDAYTDAVFEQVPEVKIVSRWGVGYDSIDVEAATRHGVIVATTPGTLHDSVADLVFALMLSAARNIAVSDRLVREGTWRYPGGMLVWGKTLGIVGLGTIGKAVARRAAGFDMQVLACDPVRDEEFAQEHGITYVSLEDLLAASDFVTLHTTLAEDTAGLIGEPELRRMKSTAILLNTGRGALVDQTALIRALTDGWITGAGLDVFEEEPLPADSPLTKLDYCVMTPHCGSFSIETIRRVSVVAAENVVAALRGRRCNNAINPAVYEAEALRACLA